MLLVQPQALALDRVSRPRSCSPRARGRTSRRGAAQPAHPGRGAGSRGPSPRRRAGRGRSRRCAADRAGADDGRRRDERRCARGALASPERRVGAERESPPAASRLPVSSMYCQPAKASTACGAASSSAAIDSRWSGSHTSSASRNATRSPLAARSPRFLAAAETAVAPVVRPPDAAIRGVAAHDILRAVGGAVVDDDQLPAAERSGRATLSIAAPTNLSPSRTAITAETRGVESDTCRPAEERGRVDTGCIGST